MHKAVSVDEFIADEHDEVGPLFELYSNGDLPLIEDGPFKVSKASFDYVEPTWDSIGSMVVGRHLFDITNGWEGTPPTGKHVVVCLAEARGLAPTGVVPLRRRRGLCRR